MNLQHPANMQGGVDQTQSGRGWVISMQTPARLGGCGEGKKVHSQRDAFGRITRMDTNFTD